MPPGQSAYVVASDPRLRVHAVQSMTSTLGSQRTITETLRPYPIPYAPQDTRRGFGLPIERLFTRIETNTKETRALATQLIGLIDGEVGEEKRGKVKRQHD